MNSRIIFDESRKEVKLTFENVYTDLVLLKSENNKEAFNGLVLSILSEIKKYINGRISSAIHQGHFSRGKYKAEDFIDQLFIEIYDNLEEVKSKNNFYKWLFKKTNQLLDDTIVEEEFDDLFFKNIDDYSKQELEGMVEKYTIDGGGDVVMLDELNESSFNPKKIESFSSYLIENDETELVEKIDKELTAEDVHNHINFVLASLPLAMRNVYDLYYSAQFSIEEISDITNLSRVEIDDLLKEAKIRIKHSFEKRF
jgi:RNA polymerase sigma factor (sigma-70 family)|tara:strand:+ start:25164 stop:25928 length:765 start_codon:yes stop_codon:yes gene_type:complete